MHSIIFAYYSLWECCFIEVTHIRINISLELFHWLDHIVLHWLGHSLDRFIQCFFLQCNIFSFFFQLFDQIFLLFFELFFFSSFTFTLDHIFNSPGFFILLDLQCLFKTLFLHGSTYWLLDIIFQLNSQLSLILILLINFISHCFLHVLNILLNHQQFLSIISLTILLINFFIFFNLLSQHSSSIFDSTECIFHSFSFILSHFHFTMTEPFNCIFPFQHFIIVLATQCSHYLARVNKYRFRILH